MHAMNQFRQTNSHFLNPISCLYNIKLVNDLVYLFLRRRSLRDLKDIMKCSLVRIKLVNLTYTSCLGLPASYSGRQDDISSNELLGLFQRN